MIIVKLITAFIVLILFIVSVAAHIDTVNFAAETFSGDLKDVKKIVSGHPYPRKHMWDLIKLIFIILAGVTLIVSVVLSNDAAYVAANVFLSVAFISQVHSDFAVRHIITAERED